MEIKKRAPKNKTIYLTEEDEKELSAKIFYFNNNSIYNLVNKEKNKIFDLNTNQKLNKEFIKNKTFCANFFEIIDYFPNEIFDLIILDPPYNISKKFDIIHFKEKDENEYKFYFENIIKKIYPLLKIDGTIYVCCEWRTSYPIYEVLKKYFKIKNRITWEREKGRGAKNNYKNCSEDIWFATKSNNYYFDVEKIKLKRKVLAPYKINGIPKDWSNEGKLKFRLTYPSNFWTDITVPFWSMSENTDHPTQKPEKLIAKLILASTKPEDFVFDPFLGSGTTSVVCKKLGRNYCGIEISELYAKITEKRLKLAEHDKNIQGYYEGFFWERNTYQNIKNKN